MTATRDNRDSTNEYDYHRRTDNWHFEKRLSLDTVVSVVSVVLFLGGPILFWGRAMDGRVQALEVIQDQRTQQQTARDMDARDQRISIITRIDKIDEQVTQLRIELGKLAPPQSTPMMGGKQ